MKVTKDQIMHIHQEGVLCSEFPKKKLSLYFNFKSCVGHFKVYHNNTVVLMTKNLDDALETYNFI